jgi:hypothetical protein
VTTVSEREFLEWVRRQLQHAAKVGDWQLVRDVSRVIEQREPLLPEKAQPPGPPDPPFNPLRPKEYGGSEPWGRPRGRSATGG